MMKWEETSTNTYVSARGETLHWTSSAKGNPKQ